MILRGDGIFFGALSLVRGLVGAVDDVKAYHDQQNVRRGRRAQQGRQNVRRMLAERSGRLGKAIGSFRSKRWRKVWGWGPRSKLEAEAGWSHSMQWLMT